MTVRDPRIAVLVVIPPGDIRPDALVAAVRRRHATWEIEAVWTGDPHLRPILTCDVRWVAGFGRGAEILSSQPECRADWWFAVQAVSRLFDRGVDVAVVLRLGSVAVLGALDALVASALGDDRASRAVFVDLAGNDPTDDGRWPDETYLLEAGTLSTSVASFVATERDAVDWLAARLADPASGHVGVSRLFERAAKLFGLTRIAGHEIIGSALGWSVDEPDLLDLTGFSSDAPWVLRADVARGQRVEVAGPSPRRVALERALDQVAGRRAPIRFPGGWLVDDAVRAAVCAPSSPRPMPDAWSEPSAFRAWVMPAFWSALHGGRADLRSTFADPFGADADRFATWRRRAVVDDGAALLADPHIPHAERWQRCSWRNDGVDLVGYHLHESSLGDVARRIAAALAAARVPHASLANLRTGSPRIAQPPPTSNRLDHRSAVLVVNADQLDGLSVDHPEIFDASTRRIGYWFWELEHVPAPMRHAASLVDEIWVGSTFVADAFRAAVDTPVRHVPIPLAAPVASDRDRASFPVLAPLGDRFVFAVVFDHFSVTERKNPVGVIEAFRRAFQPDEGPVLVVKSMNASKRWPQHQHVVAAAAGRPDIVLWDEHLDRADHMAFIAAADALVALHRSEGLGLHLAEAMWLGTPVIATRYSGNLDFMDDDCSILIDASLVPVERGEGVYPPEARWADPDLDQAAAAMRSLASDPTRCAALASAGRSRMERQPTLADTGRAIAGLLGIEMAS